MSTATRTTVHVEISSFVTAQGLHCTKEDIAGAESAKVRPADDGSMYDYLTDEGHFGIVRDSDGFWGVHHVEAGDEFEAEFRTFQEARRAIAALRRMYRRFEKESADTEARSRGFESAEDEARFQVYGENLTATATKLVAQAHTHLDARDLTWDQKINEVLVADDALRYVWMLWNQLEAGVEYKEAMQAVRDAGQRQVMSKARYAASNARREDLAELQAAARVAEGELWGYGYGW